MASSQEMLLASMGLLIATFLNLLLYLIGNSIIPTFVQVFNSMGKITPLLGFQENSYVVYLYFSFLLLFELAAIGSFIYVVARRQISGSESL